MNRYGLYSTYHSNPCPLQLACLLATRALAHGIAELRILVLRLHLMVHLHDLLVPIRWAGLLGSVTL